MRPHSYTHICGWTNDAGGNTSLVVLGESENSPFVMDSQSVSVGQPVGIPLPVVDPDVGASDEAHCREAALDGLDDDREVFGITTSCQIFVKNVSFGIEGQPGYINLESGTDTGYYNFVEAYDQGGADGKNVFVRNKVPLHDDWSSSCFDIEDITFKSPENVRGTVQDKSQPLLKTTRTGISLLLTFVCCLPDDNVYLCRLFQGSSKMMTSTLDVTHLVTQARAMAITNSNFSNCEYNSNTKQCETRQQSPIQNSSISRRCRLAKN